MEPPLWVKGDRGCSERQEILIARWGCPVRKGGVVHGDGKPHPPEKHRKCLAFPRPTSEGSQYLKQLFEKDLYSRLRNFVLGIKMEPRDVAQLVMDRVANYCENNSGDTPLECLTDHNPDQLDVFVDAYLDEEEDNELNEAIENSDNFWDEVKKEYESLWKETMSLKAGGSLGDELQMLYQNIVQNDELDDASKARRLQAYDEVLVKFADAIKRALQNKKPLSGDDLDYWYKKIGDTVFGVKNYGYYEEIGYWEGFYDELDDSNKLEVLSILLDEIDSVLYDIEHTLPDLGVLSNKS